jgi:hypothetical protein
VIVRFALLLAALGAIVLGVTRLHATDACTSSSQHAFVIALGAPGADVQAVVHGVAQHCRGATALATSVSALRRVGDDRAAVSVAEQAVRREPENFATWVGLWLAESPIDPAAAAAAKAQAHELDPRYAPTAPS